MAIIKGPCKWAKIVGKPAKGYNAGEFEWTIDVSLDDDGKAKLAEMGLESYIKNADDDRGDYISFKRKAVKSDGTSAKPIEIVGPDKQPWDPDTLIGNGSIVNVMFLANEWTFGKKKGIRPAILKVQVVKHVPYEGGDREDFEPVNDEEWG